MISKKNFCIKIKDACQRYAIKEVDLVVLFQDEARFGRIQDPKRCWCSSGIRPLVKGQIVREYIYAYSAIEPKSGKAVSLYLPRADSGCMQLFLAEVSTVYQKKKVLIFMDQAAWHKAKALVIPDNIKFEFLPPYSPELNPVELVWKLLRNRFFHNVYFNSIDAVECKLHEALVFLYKNEPLLKSLSLFSWMKPVLS